MRRSVSQFRSRVGATLLPALEAFDPQLLLVSAGFDGHCDDFYHYLTGDDYAWLRPLQPVARHDHVGVEVVHRGRRARLVAAWAAEVGGLMPLGRGTSIEPVSRPEAACREARLPPFARVRSQLGI